jgi:hypothetical protein
MHAAKVVQEATCIERRLSWSKKEEPFVHAKIGVTSSKQ